MSSPTPRTPGTPPAARRRRLVTVALLAALAAGCAMSPADAETHSGTDGLRGENAQAVRVLRDDRGVPHIVARDLESAMFALGFVHAEDRLFQMHYRRSLLQGRLAERFAPISSTPGAISRREALIGSDRFYRALGIDRDAEQTVRAMPADRRALLEAYAAGVNAQLAERPALGTLFDELQIRDVARWTAADVLLGWDAIGETFGSTRAAVQAELATFADCADADGCTPLSCGQTVIDEAAAIVPEPDDGVWPPGFGNTGSDRGIAAIREPVDIKASQAFVVAGEHLATGLPYVFGEPQLVLQAPSHWYEVHMSVPSEGIDVRGVGFAGAPGLVSFFSRHVSQVVTAGGMDLADTYALELTEDGTSYLVDGVPYALEMRDETIAVRGGDPLTIPVRRTRFGPIVGATSDGRPVAVRRADSLRPGDHSVIAGIELMRADSLESYRDALRHWVRPSVNALYGGVDAESGETHIAYHLLGVIADRPALRVGDADLRGRHPYDGSASASAWRGQLPLEWNPHVIDPPSGYLFSGNHLPVGAWYERHVYAGVRGNGDTLRSAELRQRLARLIEAPGPVDPADLHALHVDATSLTAVGLTRALRQLRDQAWMPADDDTVAPTTRAARASRVLNALERWLSEGGGVVDSRIQFDRVARAVVGQSITPARLDHFACRWAAAEAGVSHFLRAYAADPTVLGRDEADIVLRAAEGAYLALAGTVGTTLEQWAAAPAEPFTIQTQVNFTCLTEAAGGSCSLAPDFDLEADIPQDFIHTIGSTAASSWPLSVDFADVDGARALLAPGVSEEPRSPRYDDQVGPIEAKGHGDARAIPVSPLDLGRVTVTEERILRY